MHETEELKFAILVATGAMLIMAFFVISFVTLYQKRKFEEEKRLNKIEKEYNKKLLDTALNSAEFERRRIAQDLHDDIGTMLSLTKLSINQLSSMNTGLNDKDLLIIRKAQTLVAETILHVRRITRDLVPTTLERFGLSEAFDEFINWLEPSNMLEIIFNLTGEELPRQSAKVELTIYRIMQELVNNAIKHSHGNAIEINLLVSEGFLTMQVIDNGIGFNPKELKKNNLIGLGLLGIESRLAIVNGTISYEQSKYGGSKAIVKIPFRPVLESTPEPLHPYVKNRVNNI